MRQVKSTCNKCHTEITLDFSDLTFKEAVDAIEKMNNSPRECPGYHVEVGGWKRMWNLVRAVSKAYTDEEKAECKSMVSHYILQLPPVTTGTGLHKFKSYEELEQFMVGYKEGSEDQSFPVVVESINYAGETIDRADMKLSHF